MSHGTDGTIYGTDEKIAIDELIDPIKESINLAGKPKLFFIKTCSQHCPQILVTKGIWSIF
jgi:hypothetical protein